MPSLVLPSTPLFPIELAAMPAAVPGEQVVEKEAIKKVPEKIVEEKEIIKVDDTIAAVEKFAGKEVAEEGQRHAESPSLCIHGISIKVGDCRCCRGTCSDICRRCSKGLT